MKTLYKNLGGEHRCVNGEIVKQGETFESDDGNLCKKFPNKFKRVTVEAPPSNAVPPPPVLVESPSPESKDRDTKGQDVTGDFPLASKNDLIVRKDSRGWWVFDEEDDNGGKEALHEKSLKRKDVVSFITEFVGV